MLRFGEVTYLYNVDSYSDSRILIRTDKGYATIDTKKMHFDPAFIMKVVIPAYYIRKEDTLYLMKEEPQYYA